MSIIHALHPNTHKLLGYLDNQGNRKFWDDLYVHDMEGEHTFSFSMSPKIKESQYFDERARFLIPAEEGGFEEFLVYQSRTTMKNEKTVKGIATYTDMDSQFHLAPGKYTGTVKELAALVLPGTKWQEGVIEYSGIRTITIDNYIGAYSFIKKIASLFDIETRFRVEHSGSRITGRYVDLVKRVGLDNKKEIVFGKDLIDIEKTVHSDRLVTQLLCIGPERQDGTRLTTFVSDDEAYQRWNDEGSHITQIYEPESIREDMTLSELDQYGRTELNKRIASVVDYIITAASLENKLPHEKVRFGDKLRVKNPEFSPPLYADARAIRIERSIIDADYKVYKIGEVVTYKEDEIFKTFKELLSYLGTRIIRLDTPPEGSKGLIWIKPGENGKPDTIYTWNGSEWEKATPTEASDIGAETPQGAQDKADQAKQEATEDANQYTDNKKVETVQEVNQTIIQTRDNLNTELAKKAGLNYVNGEFSLVDSELIKLLGDINLITGDISGVYTQLDTINNVKNDLVAKTNQHQELLNDNNGKIITLENDVDTLEGSMSTTITRLSNIDGTLAEQSSDIQANSNQINLRVTKSEFNTLTQNVDSISSSLSVQAGQIDLKAEKSEVTAVDGKVDALQSDFASLNVSVDGISADVQSVRSDLDGLEIGGRNLAHQGVFATWGDSYTKEDSKFNLETTDRSGIRISKEIFAPETEYIISFLMKKKSGAITTLGGHAQLATGDTPVKIDGVLMGNYGSISYPDDTQSHQIEIKITTNSMNGTDDNFYIQPNRNNYMQAYSAEIWNVMVVKGNQTTDWTPAPEDTDAAISSVQQFASSIDQKADSIETNVSTLSQTVDGHTTSIDNAQSSITQISTSLQLKAEQTQVDSIAGQVSNVSSDLASLQVGVDGISANVSSLESAFDLSKTLDNRTKEYGIELFDQRYVADSAKSPFIIGAHSIISSAEIGDSFVKNTIRTTSSQMLKSDYIPYNAGTFYFEMSVYNQSTSNGIFYAGLEFYDKNKISMGANDLTIYAIQQSATNLPANQWRTFSGFVRTSADQQRSEAAYVRVRILTRWSGNSGNTYLKDVSVRHLFGAGIAAQETRVTSAETSISQLSNQITLKANQTTVDNLSGRMASAESSITTQAEQISSKVSQTDFNGNAIASLINQTATTISINASKINLNGAVSVLSTISSRLSNDSYGITEIDQGGVLVHNGAEGARLFRNSLSYISGNVYANSHLKFAVGLDSNDDALLSVASNKTFKFKKTNGDFSDIQVGSLTINNTSPKISSQNSLDIVANGQTLSISDDTLRLNGKPIGTSRNEVLWQGAWLAGASGAAPLAKNLSDCPNGIILVWSRYTNGAAQGSDWNTTVIHKRFPTFTTGGHWCPIMAIAGTWAFKYMYIDNHQVRGHSRNDTGTESGQCLRYILSF